MSVRARLAWVFALCASGCATGSDEIPDTPFGGPGGASAGDDSGDDSGDDGSTDDGLPPDTDSAGSADGTTGNGGDDGNPLCCEVGPQAGCESPATESCVCTSQPSCCQAVWSQECVDLAIACGDPYCDAGDSGDVGDSGDSGDSGGVELSCDGDFEFFPQNPAPGVPFTATFTDPVGLTWVGMFAEAEDGTDVNGDWGGVEGDGPFTWSYGFDGLEAGVWTFVFTHRETENGSDLTRATCQKQF